MKNQTSCCKRVRVIKLDSWTRSVFVRNLEVDVTRQDPMCALLFVDPQLHGATPRATPSRKRALGELALGELHLVASRKQYCLSFAFKSL